MRDDDERKERLTDSTDWESVRNESRREAGNERKGAHADAAAVIAHDFSL